MRVEIDAIRDRDRAPDAAASARLGRVLTDVRERGRGLAPDAPAALAIADELADPRHRRPAAGAGEGRHRLGRAAPLAGSTTTSRSSATGNTAWSQRGRRAAAAAPMPGTGLGILRQGQTDAAGSSTLPPEAQAQVLEKRLLLLTKANSRATVQRPGVPRLHRLQALRRQRRGDRRAALPRPVLLARPTAPRARDLPVVRRKVAEVLEPLRPVPAQPRRARSLLQILETFPRDELFQIYDRPTCTEAVMGVLRMAGAPPASAVHAPRRLRPVRLCLVYLPRDRFTTHKRLRMEVGPA